ncbi:MAG: porphobilinogen synthase [Pseudomonadota bacterium]|jgi:porphobilinogen synthase|nr:porphobilinogen synthase [Burkholderiales bacterium]
MYAGSFPLTRLRRCRKNQFTQALVQENSLQVTDLVYPVFVSEGTQLIRPIATMPGQNCYSIDQLLNVAAECVKLGIPGIALFPNIELAKKDKLASEAYNPQGLIPRAITELKQKFPDLVIFTDVALDPYTLNGHDGITGDANYVLNDITLEILSKQALCHAAAGADFVCPSDMMDGRILKIRQHLEAAGYVNTGILAYSAKYNSNFYGPFREAVGASCNAEKIDKSSYQLNPADANVAMHETFIDIQEGADIVMIKPGLPYLDILYRVKHEFKKPTAAYHVSGEYLMLKHCASFIDYNAAIIEIMLCFKRAGADFIWTYAALDVAKILNKHNHLGELHGKK